MGSKTYNRDFARSESEGWIMAKGNNSQGRDKKKPKAAPKKGDKAGPKAPPPGPKK